MINDATNGVKDIHAVVAVTPCGQVIAAEASHTSPEESILGVIHGRHVFESDTIGADNTNSVVKFEVAIKDDGVAVEPTNDDVVRGHLNRFVICARSNQDQVAFNSSINCLLNRGVIGRNVQHALGRWRIS